MQPCYSPSGLNQINRLALTLKSNESMNYGLFLLSFAFWTQSIVDVVGVAFFARIHIFVGCFEQYNRFVLFIYLFFRRFFCVAANILLAFQNRAFFFKYFLYCSFIKINQSIYCCAHWISLPHRIDGQMYKTDIILKLHCSRFFSNIVGTFIHLYMYVAVYTISWCNIL